MTTNAVISSVYPMLIQKYNTLIPDPNANVLDKINTIIDYLNQTGKLTNDVVNQWNQVMSWAMNDGLNTDVTNKINSMVADGTFSNLFNQYIAPSLGDITKLQTVDKSNLTNALNEVDQLAKTNATQLTTKATIALTVNDMKQTNFNVGNFVETLGYYAWGDGGGATYKIVAAGTGTSDNGSFINLNNGLQAQLVDTAYTNVRQFGAKADGVTDDSAAINANLAWGGMLGHKVRIPWGTFYINQTITVNNQHLEGDGCFRTYLKYGPNGLLKVAGIRNSVEKLSLSSNNSNVYVATGIEVYSASHSVFRDIEIYNFNNGILIDPNSWSNMFENIVAYYNDICFNLNGGQINNTTFYSCHAESSRIGVQGLSTDGDFHYKVSFYGCHFELNTDAGVYLNANGSYTFNGCYFERNNQSNQTDITKGGLVVSFPNTYGARPSALDLVGCYHIISNIRLKQSGVNTTTLISNYFKAISGTGIYAIEILNSGANTNKVLNINPGYESVTTISNDYNSIYELNSNTMQGSTSARPAHPTSGQSYYDTTLTKAIFWDGYNWRDGNGRTPDSFGFNVAVNAGVTSVPINFPTNQYSTSYIPEISLGWNSTWWITNKQGSGFTINFGTTPAANSVLDWKINS